MKPWALLQELRRLEVDIRPDEDRDLRLRAPRGVLGPALMEAIREHKPALLELCRAEREIRRAAASEGVYPDLPSELLRAVAALRSRFGGSIVSVELQEALTTEHVGVHPLRKCRACQGTCFWISHSGVATCRRCHPPASSRLVRVWLDDDVDIPEDAL